MSPLTIRAFAPGDELAICDIYNPYILGSTATFEEVPLQPAEMRERIDRYRAHHPWLVCEEEGRIVGYSYARPYHERAAYRHTVELSVYIRQGHGGRGIGRLLYTPLIDHLQATGCHALMAVISLPNAASVALHESLGFVKVGHLREVGRKFDRWLDIGHWQRLL